jgi:hypothetical protein
MPNSVLLRFENASVLECGVIKSTCVKVAEAHPPPTSSAGPMVAGTLYNKGERPATIDRSVPYLGRMEDLPTLAVIGHTEQRATRVRMHFPDQHRLLDGCR